LKISAPDTKAKKSAGPRLPWSLRSLIIVKIYHSANVLFSCKGINSAGNIDQKHDFIIL
jgi:hypothetical protein